MDDDRLAGLHPGDVGDGTVGGGEAAAEAGGDLGGHLVGDPDQVDVGPGERHEVGERAPLGEPRLELVLADLAVAAGACPAPSAREDERRRDPVADLPRVTEAPVSTTVPASSWPGTCGSSMSSSWPIQPCQSLRHSPVASTATTTPSGGHAGSGVWVSSGGVPNARDHHGAHQAIARPMPRAATWSAETSRALSRLRLGTTIPSAATTSPPRRTGTPTEQAPRLISSTVVA